MIRYFLSNNNIKPKINRAEIETNFEANIGTPKVRVLAQFTIYLEKAQRETRLEIDQITKPDEIEYSSDVDFIRPRKYIDLDKITPSMKK